MMNVTSVILCGGSVTRLWPLSRKGLSRQFLCLTGKESLFQQAGLRLVNLGCRYLDSIPLIFTSEDDIVRSKDTFGHVSK